jgi:hypothetical protein
MTTKSRAPALTPMAAEEAGELTVETTPLVKNSPVVP